MLFKQEKKRLFFLWPSEAAVAKTEIMLFVLKSDDNFSSFLKKIKKKK